MSLDRSKQLPNVTLEREIPQVRSLACQEQKNIVVIHRLIVTHMIRI